MARPKAKAPSLRYHISGQSVTTIDGRDFYLGKHDSPEAFARYAVLIRIYQEHGLCLPDDRCGGTPRSATDPGATPDSGISQIRRQAVRE
jgi:hypothetical protein